jgi:adenine phosphoribosyltransferase
MTDIERDVRAAIRDIPDFPKPGVLFKDITPMLADPRLFSEVIGWFAHPWREQRIDRVVGMESRGFIFGGALATELGAGFAPARKKGKLPFETVGVDYALEYGAAVLEMHVDAIKPGDRVLICDDLLATGGTAAATVDLVRKLGGEVAGAAFVIELGFLGGRNRLDTAVHSLVTY